MVRPYSHCLPLDWVRVATTLVHVLQRRRTAAPASLHDFFLSCSRIHLNRSTHCALVLPGTSSAMSRHRSFFSKEAGCVCKAASKAFCCSLLHSSAATADFASGAAEAAAPAP